ncbi:MAG TPA: NAD-dependent epimerase/dehydratase family protein [Myxococcales bacterium]|nr:NAD-dependent epimerase/dehydratase family protein [Myxococcales bacterium]
MRAVVLGGAGFIGSHLVDRLLARGDEVVAVDNILTGRRDNAERHRGEARYTFVEHDICQPIPVIGPAGAVYNLASPASPIDYAKLPLQTLDVGSLGTRNALELARRAGATLVHASTSEIYGDPLQHPQREDYFGNVNPIGPRACYDEAKRFSEALITSFGRVHGTPWRLARIFNTYGPRMRTDDGRVVPAFVTQALRGEDFTVFGDGSQTRSFCYVDDLVTGLLLLLEKGDGRPVNLGNPREMTLIEFAGTVRSVVGKGGRVRSVRPLPENDPRQRQPDITRARTLLGWEPKVSLKEGLVPTVEWFRRELGL